MKSQLFDRKIKSIKAVYPEAAIIQEAFTGTTLEGWEGTCKAFSFSRMSGTAKKGFQLYQFFTA